MEGSGVTRYPAPSAVRGPVPRAKVHLDLAADALGALAPLELDGIELVLVDDVFSDAQPGVLDVHLHQDLSVSLMVLLIQGDPAVHVRRLLDLFISVPQVRRI